jgi:undecaprenyl pyrophosphate phosphatase UppP
MRLRAQTDDPRRAERCAGGAALYGLHSVLGEFSHLPGGAVQIFAVGFLSAALSGYLCVRYFLSYLQTRSLHSWCTGWRWGWGCSPGSG